MENFHLFYRSLPVELVNKILFEHKGMTHPVANIISEHWNQMNESYNIYLNIKKEITRRHVEHDDETFTVTTEETYTELYQDYPRLYFPVEFDFIDTMIYEVYDGIDEVWEDIEEYEYDEFV